MKPITVAAGLAVACLAFAGCSSASPTTQAAPAAGGSAAATAQTTSAPPAATSNYVVTIDSATQSKDYNGKPAMIVTYTFTNKSEKASAFMTAVTAKAFQQGVQLEMAIIADSKAMDSGAGLKEIKPGGTLKVQEAYVLSDKSEVTVEVKEFASFSDEMIATKKFPVS